MPCSVSGVTIAPSRMPISTKQTRAIGFGTGIWRPSERGDRHRQHRSGDEAGRNPELRQGDAARRGDQQGLDRWQDGWRVEAAASWAINAARVAGRQMTPTQAAYAAQVHMPARRAVYAGRGRGLVRFHFRDASRQLVGQRRQVCPLRECLLDLQERKLELAAQRREVVGAELRMQRHDREIEARMVTRDRLGGLRLRPHQIVERALEVGPRRAPFDVPDRAAAPAAGRNDRGSSRSARTASACALSPA